MREEKGPEGQRDVVIERSTEVNCTAQSVTVTPATAFKFQ